MHGPQFLDPESQAPRFQTRLTPLYITIRQLRSDEQLTVIIFNMLLTEI